MCRLAMRVAGMVILALALSDCAASVSSFLPRGVDLRHRRTYDWGTLAAQSTRDPRLDNNRFFHERIVAAVDNELTKRGFAKAVAPELFVHYHVTVIDTIQFTGPERCGNGRDVGCPEVYERGTLVIDLVAGDRLIWRGWAEDAIDGIVDDQRSMEQVIDRAVALIIRQLPQGF